jgi:hypothetical protein
MDEADKKVMTSGHFPGPDALPSAYLSVTTMRPRERRVADDVAQRFATGFPADILAMRAGETLAADAAPPGNVPTLVIEYAPEWGRTNVVTMKPHTVFANMMFYFDATFAVPDGAAPLKISTRAWRGAETWRLKSDGLTREEYQQQVYDAMIDGAFDHVEKRMITAFF